MEGEKNIFFPFFAFFWNFSKQEHKVSYRCSLPSPLQKRSKDYKGLHRIHVFLVPSDSVPPLLHFFFKLNPLIFSAASFLICAFIAMLGSCCVIVRKHDYQLRTSFPSIQLQCAMKAQIRNEAVKKIKGFNLKKKRRRGGTESEGTGKT